MFQLRVVIFLVSNTSSAFSPAQMQMHSMYLMCEIQSRPHIVMLNFGQNKKTFSSISLCEHLPTAISSVYHNIRSSGKSASVARKVKKDSLQLFRIALASHGREIQPFLFPLPRDSSRYRSLDIARWNCINTCKVCPLHCKRFGKMDHSSFGRIIAGLSTPVRVSKARNTEADIVAGTYLTLWNVCYMARDRCCKDKVSGSLLSENFSCQFSTVVSSV